MLTNTITGTVTGNAVSLTVTLIGTRANPGGGILTTTAIGQFAMVVTGSTMSGTESATVTVVCSGNPSCPGPTSTSSTRVSEPLTRR